MDPTIYEGGFLPNNTDEVIFNVTEIGIWFHLESNQTYNVSSLSIYGDVGLHLRSNSSLEVLNLYLYHVWIHISTDAFLWVHEEAELEGLFLLLLFVISLFKRYIFNR